MISTNESIFSVNEDGHILRMRARAKTLKRSTKTRIVSAFHCRRQKKTAEVKESSGDDADVSFGSEDTPFGGIAKKSDEEQNGLALGIKATVAVGEAYHIMTLICGA